MNYKREMKIQWIAGLFLIFLGAFAIIREFVYFESFKTFMLIFIPYFWIIIIGNMIMRISGGK